MNETVLQIQDGTVTLPAKLRARYKLAEGDSLTLLDLGGVFVLSPGKTLVSKLAAELERKRKAAGLSIADLLEGLDEQRRTYANEKYGIVSPARSNSQGSFRRRRSRRERVPHDRG
jgi:bifunctional DNA-binding transcriptional regulator/antitoxin component of YhaV-PrlF toxin-antitoxin module